MKTKLDQATIYCKKTIFSGDRFDFGGRHCQRKAVKNGLCNFHQPENIQARSDKLDAKWKAERDASNAKYAKQERDRELLKMLPEVIETLKATTRHLAGHHAFDCFVGTDYKVYTALEKLLAKLEEA